MKIGMLARGDDRGLGYQTWDWHSHMHPDRTLLVVEPGSVDRGFVTHLDRYPDAAVVDLERHGLDEHTVRRFLAGLDVVYTAETFYDPRFYDWARAAGVATVQHINPEFWPRHHAQPTQVWSATAWRLAHLPATARVVPVPVPWWTPTPRRAGPVRFVHVAGTRATGDRNGTIALAKALRECQTQVHVRIVTQTSNLPRVRYPANVHVQHQTCGVADRRDLYEASEVLLLPRRYGGLCLPVLEAAGFGLGVVMPDTTPNDDGPAMLVGCQRGRSVSTPAGEVCAVDVDVEQLAKTIDRLATTPDLVDAIRLQSSTWAAGHTWDRLAGQIRDELERAAALVR